jgi:hypothetical protein
MEALGYVFVYFLQKGNLPWKGLPAESQSEKELAILRTKQQTSPEELCKGLLDEFVQYFKHIKLSRDTDHEVDYKYLLRLFHNLFRHQGFEHDYGYDWTVLKYIEHLQKQGVKVEDEMIDTEMLD